MQKTILVFHSVSSETNSAVKGSFPISMDRFQSIVQQAMRKGWSFGSVSDVFKPAQNNTFYITGDDGTVDWARNVLPWCEQEGIPTHTALITGPWLPEPIYPIPHRVQIILAITGRRIPHPRLTSEQIKYIDKAYAYETDPRRRYLKGACNLVLDFDEASAALGPPDEEETGHLRARFESAQAYRSFKTAEFGVHTLSHRAFDGDVNGYLQQEILPCREMIKAAGLKDSGFFTQPIKPRPNAYIEQLIEPLREAGFKGIFSGEGQWNGESFIINRIDAKQAEKFLGLEIRYP